MDDSKLLIYEGSTTIHNVPLCSDQVKVGVEEVRDADACVPIPTKEVQLVGQTLNTFLAWPAHLLQPFSEQGLEGPLKPVDRSDLDVLWDAIVFGVYNDNFPFYIKHEDLSKIEHDCHGLSIFVIQLWILHMNETSM
ncbi:hypothetical protein GmHk_10G028671 [Glycine max]|nr:hypothetical protein GmHk_10G028671 [Glycine max]